ncbi:MAG: GAF domain-containing protein [Bdellovibrionales bacterium]|nr:GAF domain-containing protein [Bdellovibrionales bacterium]
MSLNDSDLVRVFLSRIEEHVGFRARTTALFRSLQTEFGLDLLALTPLSPEDHRIVLSKKKFLSFVQQLHVSDAGDCFQIGTFSFSSPVLSGNGAHRIHLLEKDFRRAGLGSYVVSPIRCGNRWSIVVAGSSSVSHSWEVRYQRLLNELFPFVVRRGRGARVTESATKKFVPSDSSENFRKLVEYGQLFIGYGDYRFQIKNFVGDSLKLFGVEPERLTREPDIWDSLVDVRDLRRLRMKFRRMKHAPHEFGEEIRITHQRTKEVRSFLMRAVPSVTPGVLEKTTWTGFAVDITHQRKTEEELRSQRSRIEALFEVSRALKVNLDPALVALKGLRALLQATRSDSGFVCFYEENADRVEVVAAEGLSQKYIDAVTKIVGGQSLVRVAIESKEGFLIPNIQIDNRASTSVAKIENLKSTIVFPLLFEERVLGALVLFCREENRYSSADYQLVAAAAGQISLSARQAEQYVAEKRQADSLAVLYRLSHELSRLFHPREVAQQAFAIVQEELACKRMWLGLMNQQGTHLVGQAGFGPGVRKQLQEIQIELDLRHDFLDEALKTRQAVVVEAGSGMQCSGLEKIIERLNIGTLIIVPLVSLGQVVGVFLIEPSVSSREFVRKKLSLLSSMATEIAAVLLARRFESRLADADKMRMASVLASGVAHNFNNLLQAVMGQASLIEMQLPESSPLRESARTIVDAATRGAGLVKHLLTFSSRSIFQRKALSLGSLVEESRDLYSSLLGGNIILQTEVEPEVGQVHGDYQLIQQIVSNLLVNAKEAIGKRDDGIVKLSVSSVRVRSGEVHPELSPGVYLRLDVADNGVGMDADRQTRCFEPFYSTKELDLGTGLSLSGSGLGLSSAYSIARQHDGVITVSSSPGEGAIFSVYLPRYAPERSESLSELRGSESPRVIILEPDTVQAQNIKEIIDSLGYEGEVRSNLQRTLRDLQQEDQQRLGVVILDVDKFMTESRDAIESLVETLPNMRVAAITVDQERWKRLLRQVDRVTVLEKPVRAWSFEGIARELRRLSSQSESAARPLRTQIEKSEEPKAGKENSSQPYREDHAGHDEKGTPIQ